MKYALLSASALAISAASAHAAGLDRSGQSIAPIFATDNTASLSFGYVMPSLTGEDIGGPGDYDDSVGENYSVIGLSYTNAVNSAFNYSVILDQPYGVDIDYGADPTASNLGGTAADLDSNAVTFVGRYRFNENFSVFAGIKAQRVEADVDLNGIAYRNALSVAAVAEGAGVSSETLGAALQGDPASVAELGGLTTVQALGAQVSTQSANFAINDGYKFRMDQDTQPGYLIGAAYERPDIALRIAGTYHFEIEHEADITEEVFGASFDSDIDYVTPASFNLEFQTGIAPGTLLLGSYRWTQFSEVDLVPEELGRDLVNLEDGHRYTLGLGRAFSEELSGSATIIYEPKGDDLVSPLGPTNGLWGLSVGGRYTNGNMNISGGLNYSWVGDADAEVGGNAVASFEDNHAVGIGLRAEVTF
ncbi:outer membrane protein transport protein [Roseivivax sp. THAF30]|uniref:outer membrane protein transport protein n=1 Tax=Roseivivax sp. THAF30 TaxID=2587852 RepID=UPI0012A78CC7|nr:outer membrane protein transport protein [Roseivivax sp. THAF30]QFT63240.1 Outer membrane protein transport protein (OMPP1/FadL/TodX) [Roseivivax sp. THAF30]